MNFKKFHESKNLLEDVITGANIVANGLIAIDAQYNIWIAKVTAGETYRASNVNGTYGFYTEKPTTSSVTYNSSRELFRGDSPTIEVPQGVSYIGIRATSTANNVMLNTGSAPLPYEPYSSEVWHDIPYYQHKTATDTLTLPAVIYPNDASITVGIKGQSSQASTPTPSQPCDVLGCGERTTQLFEYAQNATATTINTVVWTIANGVIHGSGTTTSLGGQDSILVTKTGLQRSGNYPSYLPISAARDLKLPAGTYTFSYNAVAEPTAKDNKPRLIVGHNGASVNKGTATAVYNGDTFTCDGDDYVALTINTTTDYDTYEFGDFMINSGSTPQPYEPYGYKIPISMGGTTTPVYLGEVQTTRKIKKLVLTGEETVTQSIVTNCVQIDTPDSVQGVTVYSSHFQSVVTIPTETMRNGKVFHVQSVGMGSLCFGTNSKPPTFKQWLSDQYAADTPVTIWYVLAEPTTGIVNEPLMKIGDYADSLSASIPCTAGENTLDVQTTVQPSEVTAGFSGWHPVQSVHESENGQWD